ncbi:MAG TPA: hypothetical protein VFX78_07170 [Candidatus Eisenbacteria bacterium]|nr:hypothetical protein [Candidatus Eisenbacteria bacterium]
MFSGNRDDRALSHAATRGLESLSDGTFDRTIPAEVPRGLMPGGAL